MLSRAEGGAPGYGIGMFAKHISFADIPAIAAFPGLPGREVMEEFDEADLKILATVSDLSGSQISEIARKSETGLSDHTIRDRIARLSIFGAVMLDRTRMRNRVFVSITGYGKELLDGIAAQSRRTERHD